MAAVTVHLPCTRLVILVTNNRMAAPAVTILLLSIQSYIVCGAPSYTCTIHVILHQVHISLISLLHLSDCSTVTTCIWALDETGMLFSFIRQKSLPTITSSCKSSAVSAVHMEIKTTQVKFPSVHVSSMIIRSSGMTLASCVQHS